MIWVKRIILILIIIIGLTTIFSYFGLFNIPKLPFLKPPNISLTYWGLWEDEKIIQPLLEEYKTNHPNVTINYIKQTKFQYRERLKNALEKSEGPDIFRFHNTWLPMFTGDLSPLPEKIMTISDFQKTYYPVISKDLIINNQVYALPLYIDTLALFYNEDLLLKAGVNVPKTWEEFRTAANRLTVKDEDERIKIAGAAIGSTGNVEHFSDILGLMLIQNGTDPKKITSSYSSDGRNLGEDTLKYYTNFVLIDKVWDETMDNSIAAFSGEKVAMIFAPSWEIFEIKNLNENLNFQISIFPQLPQNTKNWATYWVEGVSKKSRNQKAAWEFLSFLAGKESLQKLYTNASQYRLFGEPYPQIEMANLIKNDPLVNVFIEQAGNNATSWYFASRTYDNGINDKNIKYLEDAVNFVLKGGTPTEALKTTEKGITQILERYQLL